MYYRDGVADSQFETVITKELVEIREAIRDLKRDHPDWWPVRHRMPMNSHQRFKQVLPTFKRVMIGTHK
jgi:hypothetical protein